MAEDEDGVSNKNSPQNSNDADSNQENEQNATKPDLGIEEAKYNSQENGHASPTKTKSSSTKSTGAVRKEENPFSFRHFLKRDLSLPGNSTYEHTGARPKVYANTVQHSPTKVDVHTDSRREKSRQHDNQTKDKTSEGACRRVSDNAPSTSSMDVPFSMVGTSNSKNNFYSENADVPFYHRPNLASEPMGMPSLPDFVQDHILVEQAYLHSNGPMSLDLDNLPDFTFNTNFNAGSSSSLGRRNETNYIGNRGYDYDPYMGASTSSDLGPSNRNIPLDLPEGAEAAGPIPLDHPMHLSLDLTESVNPSDRRNMSPRNTFPLDLPPNAESKRLPDFLPVHPGRTSPEPEHQDEQLQQIMSELERTRSELFTERSRRCRAEEEAACARARLAERERELREHVCAPAAPPAPPIDTDPASAPVLAAPAHLAEARSAEPDVVSKLKNEIKKLKEQVRVSQEEARGLRAGQAGAAADLRRASRLAETSLRELLAGVEQLSALSSRLDPT